MKKWLTNSPSFYTIIKHQSLKRSDFIIIAPSYDSMHVLELIQIDLL